MPFSISRRFGGEATAAWLLVALTLTLNAIWLAPELAVGRIDLNDHVLHYAAAARMAAAMEQSENPFDHWVSEWTLGYPVPRTYQPLGSFTVAGLYLLLGKSVPLMTLFVWVRFLLLLLFPLSVYCGARLLELDRLRSAAAALVTPLVATGNLFGLEFGSYVWRGSGLYTQAWAMHLLVLTLGVGFRAFSRGRGLTPAGVLLALTFLYHFVYGYMAALSLALLAVLHPREEPVLRRGVRLAWVAAVSMALTAWVWLPLWIDKPFINRSRWEAEWKWDSFGFAEVVRQVFSGDLLDFGRLPVLTLLAAAGIASWALSHWGLPQWGPPQWGQWRAAASENFGVGRTPQPTLRFVAAGAGLWLFLYCGRQSWGVLLTLLGASEEMPLHRLIGGVHLFALLWCGIGLGGLWHWLARRKGVAGLAWSFVVTILVLWPAWDERASFLAQGAEWGRQNLAAHGAEAEAVEEAIAAAKSRPGRTFAGLAGDWGRSFGVGSVPMYGLLATNNEPAIGMLYHAMALTSDVVVRFNEWRSGHYRLFNVSTMLVDSSRQVAEFLEPAGRHGRFQVYEAPGGGFFDLVRAPFSAQADKHTFYDINDPWLAGDWVEKRQHIRLDFTSGALPELPRLDASVPLPQIETAEGLGEVRSETQIGEAYSAQVRVDQACYLLFKMTYHRNWRVLVNGEPRETVVLTPGMLGVALGPGEYRIECRYEPEVWRIPLLLAGLAGGLLLFVGERRGMPAAAGERAAGWIERARQAVPADRRRRLAIAGGLALLALPVCVPLFSSQVLVGHDALEYAPRLIEFHENIRSGVLIPRWAPDLSLGYGQPFFVFNPPLVYYLGEVWMLAGLDPVTALNLTCVLLVAGSAAAMFLLGQLWFGLWGGWLAAAAYLYAPYFHVDLFVRQALAEFAAFPFYPLALYGFGRFAQGRDPRFLLLGAAGYACVIAAHHPAAFLFSPLLLSFVIIQAARARSWKLLLSQFGGLALGLGFGASIWLPALLERQFVKLDRLFEGYLQFTNHFVFLQQFFETSWEYGLSLPGYGDGMSFSLGWSHILLAIAGWTAARRWRPEKRWILGFFAGWCLLLCVLMLSGSEWFWATLPLMKYIEFPWRLLAPASLCLAVVAAALGRRLNRLEKGRNLALAAALGLLILPNLSHIAAGGYQTLDWRQWTPEQIAQRGVSVTTRNEYEPNWAQLPAYRTDSVRAVAGWAQGELRRLSPVHWSGQVRAASPSTIEVSCYYFPGWHAWVDGREVPPGVAENSGLIRLAVPAGDHYVELAFRRTPVRLAADAISVFSVFVISGLWAWWRRNPPIGTVPEDDAEYGPGADST